MNQSWTVLCVPDTKKYFKMKLSKVTEVGLRMCSNQVCSVESRECNKERTQLNKLVSICGGINEKFSVLLLRIVEIVNITTSSLNDMRIRDASFPQPPELHPKVRYN